MPRQLSCSAVRAFDSRLKYIRQDLCTSRTGVDRPAGGMFARRSVSGGGKRRATTISYLFRAGSNTMTAPRSFAVVPPSLGGPTGFSTAPHVISCYAFRSPLPYSMRYGTLLTTFSALCCWADRILPSDV